MESKGPGLVVNSDSSNLWFLRELRAELPEAKHIAIENDPAAVVRSLNESYGPYDYTRVMDAYRVAFDQVGPVDLMVSCRDWDTHTSRLIWRCVAGDRPLDEQWLEQVEGMLVQLMPWRIEQDKQLLQEHTLDHIVAASTKGK